MAVIRIICFLAAALWAAVPAVAQDQEQVERLSVSDLIDKGQPQPEILPLAPLSVRTASGRVHGFQVEVARTDHQRTIGMMFRTSLPAGRGMLFQFAPAQQVSFWMRNTLIPLDMLFIRRDGRIANIIENAEPLSLDLRSSLGPVTHVLELAGGTAGRLGIKPGDKVVFARPKRP